MCGVDISHAQPSPASRALDEGARHFRALPLSALFLSALPLSALPLSALHEQVVVCPVCQQPLPGAVVGDNAVLNEHMDLCLNRDRVHLEQQQAQQAMRHTEAKTGASIGQWEQGQAQSLWGGKPSRGGRVLLQNSRKPTLEHFFRRSSSRGYDLNG